MKTPKRETNFRASADGDVAKLYIYDDIGESWWGGGIGAKAVVKALEDARLAGSKSVCVHINSGGGDVFEGAAIYSAIRAFSGKKSVCIDGIAASAASVIAMAADPGEISISRAGMVMVHNPSGFCMGESKDMKKTAEVLDKVRETMLDVYAKRTGLGAANIADMCDAETWMTAVDAKKQCFADKILEDAVACTCGCDECDGEECAGCDCDNCTCEEDNEEMAASAAKHKFKNAPPEALRLLARAHHPAARVAASAAQHHPQPEVDMNAEEKKALEEKLATMTARAEGAEKTVAEMCAATGKASAGEAIAVVAGLKETAGRVAELTAKLEKQETEAKAAKVVEMLDAAAKDGRLPPAKREELMKAEAPAFAKDPEQLKAFLDCLPKQVVQAETQAPKESGDPQLTDDEKNVCAQMKIDPAQFVAQKKAKSKK
jgi:ATP-dependent protease ClpP protease subunit